MLLPPPLIINALTTSHTDLREKLFFSSFFFFNSFHPAAVARYYTLVVICIRPQLTSPESLKRPGAVLEGFIRKLVRKITPLKDAHIFKARHIRWKMMTSLLLFGCILYAQYFLRGQGDRRRRRALKHFFFFFKLIS